MKFSGTFMPPALGATTRQVPIAGPGQLDINADGLVASGWKPVSAGLRVFLFLAGTVALVFIATAFGPSYVQSPYILGLVAFALFSAFKRNTAAYNKDRPVALSVPWAHVKKVERDPADDTRLVLTIEKHDPSGMIWLVPDGGVDRVLDGIADALTPRRELSEHTVPMLRIS